MESVVGSRVRDLRESRGWTQRQLAERMKARGFDWHQTTAAKTEAADRPLRVNEVYALARAFDESVMSLLTEPDRGGNLHSLLVALDAERVAIARRDEVAEQLEAAGEAVEAARRMREKAEAAVKGDEGGGDGE